MIIIKGKSWVFGDNVDTDQIIATQYLILPMLEMKKHTLEIVSKDFAALVRPGDIMVGGKNFGCGSSREQAPQVLKELGLTCVIAEGFARIFYRNCINIGLPVIQIDGISKILKNGDAICIDFKHGTVTKNETRESFGFQPLPAFLMDIIHSGGLIESVNKEI